MKKLVVIGDPVEHSLSPLMHNTALSHLGINNDYHYDKLRVTPDELPQFVQRIRDGEYIGGSVTLPHKVKIIPYLDSLTKEAEMIGAVNTIFIEDNTITGQNTDGIGCLKAFLENGVDIKNKSIVLLGAGGSARGVGYTFAESGADSILILNRTVSKASELTSELEEATGCKVVSGDLNELDKKLLNKDILINCTSVGLSSIGENDALVTAGSLQKNMVVMDIVYSPLRTKLLLEAEKAGCATIGGLDMLVHQGAEAFRLWTGKQPDVEVMRSALINYLDDSK